MEKVNGIDRLAKQDAEATQEVKEEVWGEDGRPLRSWTV